MRRFALAAVLAAALLLGSAVPAFAHPNIQLGPTLPTDLTHAATDNVEYLGRFPEHTGTAGGYPSEDGALFYLTDPRGVFVYDTTTPESPELLGSIPIFQQTTGAALAQEDPDTNGEILLVDGATTPVGVAALQVVDVSDPENLKILSSVRVTDHTWTCVSGIDAKGEPNSCAYAYGRTGHIVDLTDPANATLLPVTWRQSVGYGARSNSPYTHDLTEIRPGLVMTSGADAVLMDTTDPTAPVFLTQIDGAHRWSSLGYHSVEWANDGRDPYVVLGTEIAPSGATNLAGSDCEGENSVIETWDATQILAGMAEYEAGAAAADAFGDKSFTLVDSFDAGGRGIFLDGEAPGHVLYCAHWMELHPDFNGGGLMTVSYYNRGTRFVEVAADGTMSEIGWITPAEGYSGSSQWVSNDVVYIMDYRRGMEVVRLVTEDGPGGEEPPAEEPKGNKGKAGDKGNGGDKGKAGQDKDKGPKPKQATGTRSESPSAVAVGSSYVPPSALHFEQGSALALILFALLAVGAERRRRRS